MDRKPKYGDPLCLDCDTDTLSSGEYYMLNDNLWKVINPALRGMLCITCAEKRLGRALTRHDFKDAAVNDPSLSVFSPLLLMRLV